MDQCTLESTLSELNLSAIRFIPRLDSTNDEASRWINAGAPDRALVVADEQTAGRGRANRRWFTPPGAGLAFSIILYSSNPNPQLISRMTGIGALAIRDAIQNKYALPVQIKWPNDILIERRKVAGVLAEAHWNGNTLKAIILGIGINITPASVSRAALPVEQLNFPATCIEDVLGYPVNRLEILHAVLQGLLVWQPRLYSPEFIREWETSLAFRDEWVDLIPGERNFPNTLEQLSPPIEVGKVMGLAPDGSLKLLTQSGKVVTTQVGEIRLRFPNDHRPMPTT
jgi:BirA family biotin operon repressor/biotin-[acetyl-CoA-carboxylase] ligase